MLAGAKKSGLSIPSDEKVYPSQERIKGGHIKGFDPKMVDKTIAEIDSKVKA